jgi:hypothetical protein
MFAILFSAAMLAWGVYCLSIGRIRGKPYTRREDPVAFWFYIVVYVGTSLTCFVLVCWLAARGVL